MFLLCQSAPSVTASPVRIQQPADCRRRGQRRPRHRKHWLGLFNILLIGTGCLFWQDDAPSTAFYYGNPVPAELFQRYEQVVVEADQMSLAELPVRNGVKVFAYVSVGEAERWRAGHEKLDKAWFLGVNTGWNSDVADITSSGWRNYILDQRIADLWARGYRGFFLDTLDSYRSVLPDPAAQAAQQEALTALIREMHRRFPGIHLLFNRGFELLPEVGNLATGIVAESLFYAWDPASQRYKEVDKKDHVWLLERLRKVRRRYHLPVTVIDYLPPDQRELALQDAQRIADLGFTPWIAPPSLDVIGIGSADLVDK